MVAGCVYMDKGGFQNTHNGRGEGSSVGRNIRVGSKAWTVRTGLVWRVTLKLAEVPKHLRLEKRECHRIIEQRKEE